ncbi:MAG: cell division protein FtsX [Flavobacteriales bacterium]|nr:cell division protein FtsX [Flavobacteriales bacterium]|tara:strand:- start:75 stop:950 length:876 start_codon:yes stop_codon:yes gene_type:complete
MAKAEPKPSTPKVRTTYISTIISTSLVLFLLGLLAMMLINANALSNYVKENIGFSMYLSDDFSPQQLAALQKSLEARPYTNRLEYTSKEDAAKLMEEDLGEDFVEFLGYNPLTASLDLYLKADYAVPDSISQIEAELNRSPIVKEVVVQKDLISEVNENVNKIGLILFVFSILLLIVVIALINNTIRLAIYSKRFLIKTMQLVGATSGFIRRPFVTRGILNGVISSFIAIALLLGVMYSVQQNLPEFIELQNFNVYLVLFALVVLMGILISWLSTALAVRKFLRVQSGDLY